MCTFAVTPFLQYEETHHCGIGMKSDFLQNIYKCFSIININITQEYCAGDQLPRTGREESCTLFSSRLLRIFRNIKVWCHYLVAMIL